MNSFLRNLKRFIFVIVISLVVLIASISQAATWYVNGAAQSNGDGSMPYPFNDLQYTFNYSLVASGDTIVIAGGTYKPGTVRTSSFEMSSKRFNLDGGWNPTFTTWVRDPSEETILSGNIGAFNDATDNCYTVLKLSNSGMNDSNTVISNLTITGGYANGTTSATYSGGGVRVTAGSPRFHNCKIIGNVAGDVTNHTGQGGGVYVYNASPIFTVCTIAENSMTPDGTTGNGTGLGAGIYGNSALK